jgi:hypothetical protein
MSIDYKVKTRLNILSGDEHQHMINYSSKYIDEIFRYVINSEKIIAKPNQPNKLTVSHLHSYIGWRGYLKGLGLMSAEERMAASAKGYENGLGAMSAEERMAASAKGYEKGYENGLGAMSAEERMAASAKGYENGLGAMFAAKRNAKWTAEIDASIERMIDDGVSSAEIASKLGNGLSKGDIYHRWNRHLKKSSSITKPPVQPGVKSRITWTEDIDASIERMIDDGVSCAKIASELGNGLSKNDIENRWNRHLKDKL